MRLTGVINQRPYYGSFNLFRRNAEFRNKEVVAEGITDISIGACC